MTDLHHRPGPLPVAPDEGTTFGRTLVTTHRLILMRHGRAALATDGMEDRERTLVASGRRDAAHIAARLVERQWSPQAVLCSDATRTRQTWEAVQPELPAPEQFVVLETLYLAGFAALRHALGGLSVPATTVLAIGHNPGWEEVAEKLSGKPVTLDTAHAALLEIEASGWSEAMGRTDWRLVDVLRTIAP